MFKYILANVIFFTQSSDVLTHHVHFSLQTMLYMFKNRISVYTFHAENSKVYVIVFVHMYYNYRFKHNYFYISNN